MDSRAPPVGTAASQGNPAAERRGEARRKPRDAARLGEFAAAGRSGRGDYVLSDLSVLLLRENKGCGTGVEFHFTL